MMDLISPTKMRQIYRFIKLMGFFVTFNLASDTPYPVYHLNTDQWQYLINGEVVVIHTTPDFGDGEHFQAYILIEAPIEDIFAVVSNFSEYNQFMPRVQDVLTTNLENSDPLFTYIIDLPLGLEYKYRISINTFTSDSLNWLSWQMKDWDENSIADTWGQWVLTPIENDPETILVQYQAYTDPGYVPYGLGWVVDMVTKNNLPEILMNTKKRVKKYE